jgi:LmbE family N-acetylglucosaminyl deacetylase
MSAVLLAPHNDDEVLFATFLALRYQPHVIVCFKSERMGEPGYPGNMPVSAEEREAETAAAMDLLGLDWTQWPIGDRRPDGQALHQQFAKLYESKPELVIAPAFEEDGHSQHNMIATLAESYFRDSVPIAAYLSYTSGDKRSTVGIEVQYEPEWVELKLRALACYRSQILHPATGHHFLGGLREYVQA